MTLTLTDFLLARIAEDKAAALAAAGDYLPAEFGAWEVDELWDGEPYEVCVFPERGGSTTVARTWRSEQGRVSAAHIARWDPAHVLALCEVRRQIVKLHGWTKAAYIGDEPQVCCEMCGTPLDDPEPWPCETLRLLGSLDAEHPDYREEWRP